MHPLSQYENQTLDDQQIQEVQAKLKADPRLWRAYGDVSTWCRKKLFADVSTRSIEYQSAQYGIEEMRADYLKDGASYMERIIVEQLITNWLKLGIAEDQLQGLEDTDENARRRRDLKRACNQDQIRFDRSINLLNRTRKHIFDLGFKKQQNRSIWSDHFKWETPYVPDNFEEEITPTEEIQTEVPIAASPSEEIAEAIQALHQILESNPPTDAPRPSRNKRRRKRAKHQSLQQSQSEMATSAEELEVPTATNDETVKASERDSMQTNADQLRSFPKKEPFEKSATRALFSEGKVAHRPFQSDSSHLADVTVGMIDGPTERPLVELEHEDQEVVEEPKRLSADQLLAREPREKPRSTQPFLTQPQIADDEPKPEESAATIVEKPRNHHPKAIMMQEVIEHNLRHMY